MKITVKYIDTTPYVAHVHYDQGTESPAEWGNFDIKVFGCRDINNASRDDFYDDNDNLQINMVSRLRFGTAFPITIRNYSSAGDYFYDLADSADGCDGFITFTPEYVKGESYDRRREYAIGDLATYQQWANGDVYYVEIKTKEGQEIDSCGGIYGDEGIKAYIEETVPGAQNVEAIGHYDQSGSGTYEITL